MKKIFLISTIAIISLVAVAARQEKVTLTTPLTKPSTSEYTVSYIILDWRNERIIIELQGNNGELLSKTYDNDTIPTGKTLMTALNTANLSTRSLNKRLFDRLIQDKVITGNVVEK